jgi:hypothetical protein
MPVASASAFASAGATGLIGHSPMPFAPNGPVLSVDDRSRVVEHDPLVERPADALRHGPLDLSLELHRVDHRARVRRVHALQDEDFAADGVDGDAEAMDIEGDAARRAIRLAREPELMPALLGCLGQIDERYPHLTADDPVVIHAADVARDAGLRRREVENPLAQRFRSEGSRFAGDGSAGAGEGAGIEAGAIRVGLHHADARGGRAEQAGRDLHVLCRRTVAELRRASRQLVLAVVLELDGGV